ncbi:MAG: flagellar hook-length control protein FliK [Planctomycetota bacterium]|nr:MAG: flagellar hook-length control protein FliK [Planctomycetota bacterium]
MPPAMPPHSGAASGGLLTADGRPIELALDETQRRSLNQVLKPGSVVSGRVVEHFSNDSYLVTLRGRNIIAESNAPLMRDSIVQLAVLATDNGISLRLAGISPSDHAQTSAPAQRLQAAGLQVTPSALLALTAFEEHGAPLSPVHRLQQAERALTEAMQRGLPAADLQRMAASHALLASARLPVTPVTVAMAEHVLSAQPTNLAQSLRESLQHLQPQQLQQLLAQARSNLAQTSAAVASPPPGPAIAAGSSAAPPATALASEAAANPSAPMNAAMASLGAPSGGAGVNPDPAATRAPAEHLPPAPRGPRQGPSTAPPSAGERGGTPGATSPGAAPAPITPALQALLQAFDLAHDPKTALRHALDAVGIRVPLAPSPTTPQAANTSANITPNLAAGFPAIGSSPAMMGAPEAGNEWISKQDDVGSLLKTLASMARALAPDGSPEQAAQRAAMSTMAREVLGEAALPPRGMVDYDLVLPLSLFDRDQAIPIRVGISQRQHGGMNATFLRIDVELSRLGPLSLRFTESPGSPIGLSIFHTPQVRSMLEGGIGDLQADLEAQGLEVFIRLLDMTDES